MSGITGRHRASFHFLVGTFDFSLPPTNEYALPPHLLETNRRYDGINTSPRPMTCEAFYSSWRSGSLAPHHQRFWAFFFFPYTPHVSDDNGSQLFSKGTTSVWKRIHESRRNKGLVYELDEPYVCGGITTDTCQIRSAFRAHCTEWPMEKCCWLGRNNIPSFSVSF